MSRRPAPATAAMLRTLSDGSDRVRRGPLSVVRGGGPRGVGYAVGKSVGSAVRRNRVRRRIREAVRIGVEDELIDATFLVVGRSEADDMAFSELVALVRGCFEELHDRCKQVGRRARR